MSAQQEEEPVPVHEGPDPKDWADSAPWLHDALLNVEFLGRAQAALDGQVPPEAREIQEEARDFLRAAREEERAALAAMILRAYRIRLPEPPEPPELATEAVGGFSGDSDGPGDRDHV